MYAFVYNLLADSGNDFKYRRNKEGEAELVSVKAKKHPVGNAVLFTAFVSIVLGVVSLAVKVLKVMWSH